jgi:hypothetical protein
MHVVVQHRITDPEKFFSMNAEEVAGGGPPGVQGRQFFPSQDRSAAVCLWEADSIDTLRDYLDPATAGVSENAYFEVDRERAMGLPEKRRIEPILATGGLTRRSKHGRVLHPERQRPTRCAVLCRVKRSAAWGVHGGRGAMSGLRTPADAAR